MASPDLLDFKKLLAPIPGSSPAGANLRADGSPSSLYQTIKGARTKARTEERRLESGERDSTPDWSPILNLVPEAVAEKSKDLELAAWLTEALIRQHGFQGLRDGFRLMRQLVAQYWDHLYPEPDEDGITTRVAALVGLNGADGAEGTLIAPINGVSLTGPPGDVDHSVARWQCRQATELANLDPDRLRKRLAANPNAMTLDRVEKAGMAASPLVLKGLSEDLTECVTEFDELVKLIDGELEKAKKNTLSSSLVRNTLLECKKIVEGFGGPPSPLPDPDPDPLPKPHPDPHPVPAPGPIEDRNQAFQALLEVAQFFKRTEPHSPVSYALERIVKWGRMPLPELLSELIAEESSRTSVYKLVGIPPPKEPDHAS